MIITPADEGLCFSYFAAWRSASMAPPPSYFLLSLCYCWFTLQSFPCNSQPDKETAWWIHYREKRPELLGPVRNLKKDQLYPADAGAGCFQFSVVWYVCSVFTKDGQKQQNIYSLSVYWACLLHDNISHRNISEYKGTGAGTGWYRRLEKTNFFSNLYQVMKKE